MRIIIVTGKGGVGKTSVAAAMALRASKLGLKTLVMSTDSAHSLADCFDLPLTAEPVPIGDNLYGQEVDARNELLKNWGNMRKFISSTLQSRGIDNIVAEELSVFPGMEELFSLLLVKRYYQEGIYDLVILDCAPTESTIRLLSFPDVLNWYLKKIFPDPKAGRQDCPSRREERPLVSVCPTRESSKTSAVSSLPSTASRNY